jgi:hypothetical protein
MELEPTVPVPEQEKSCCASSSEAAVIGFISYFCFKLTSTDNRTIFPEVQLGRLEMKP